MKEEIFLASHLNGEVTVQKTCKI